MFSDQILGWAQVLTAVAATVAALAATWQTRLVARQFQRSHPQIWAEASPVVGRPEWKRITLRARNIEDAYAALEVVEVVRPKGAKLIKQNDALVPDGGGGRTLSKDPPDEKRRKRFDLSIEIKPAGKKSTMPGGYERDGDIGIWVAFCEIVDTNLCLRTTCRWRDGSGGAMRKTIEVNLKE